MKLDNKSSKSYADIAPACFCAGNCGGTCAKTCTGCKGGCSADCTGRVLGPLDIL